MDDADLVDHRIIHDTPSRKKSFASRIFQNDAKRRSTVMRDHRRTISTRQPSKDNFIRPSRNYGRKSSHKSVFDNPFPWIKKSIHNDAVF